MGTLKTCQLCILAALTLFTTQAVHAESALLTLRQGFMPDVTTLLDGSYIIFSQESKNGGGAIVERFNSNNSVVFPRTILPSMETKWNSIQALSNGGYLASGFIDSAPSESTKRGLGWWEFDKTNTLVVGPKHVNEQKSYCGSYGFRDSLIYAANYAVSATHACGADWNLYLFVTKPDGQRVYDALVSNTPGDQRQAELVQLTDGNVLIAWSDNSGLLDKSGWGVYGRIFSLQSMSFITEQFLINQITQGDQGYIGTIPFEEFQELKTFHVVALKNGGFMVAWIDARDGAQTNIYGRTFNNKLKSYSPAGNEFLLNGVRVNNEDFVDLSLMPSGDILVVYQSETSSGSSAMYGKIINTAGSTLVKDFKLGSVQYHSPMPRATVISSTKAVAVWNNGEG